MNTHKLLQLLTGIIFFSIILTGCNQTQETTVSQVIETETPTSAPPTDTPTPVPATETPTSLPVTDTPAPALATETPALNPETATPAPVFDVETELNEDWLITAEDLNGLEVDLGIVGWELSELVPGNSRICRDFSGQSWS